MGTQGSQQPLLQDDKVVPFSYIMSNKTSFLQKSTKWVLKFAMCSIFTCWAAFLFLVPLKPVNRLSSKLVHATSGTLFGITGSIFMVHGSAPLMIAFLAIIYLGISGEEEIQEKKKRSASFRLWTFPILIDGPFGVVNAAELIGILLFSLYIIWAVIVLTFNNMDVLSLFEFTDVGQRILFLVELTGLRFGYIGLICMVFLFLPIARGSVLLRVLDIPFEHATRYHVWLGHLIMTLFALHGLCYVIAWTFKGRLLQELIAWKKDSIAILPGAISLSAGLLMWVTSLPPVRRMNFELFFYTHQLYVVFVVFLAMHVGEFIFSIAASGIFLFMLDRFLRFFQSRKTVDILSAKCLPSGTLELVISKPQGLRYNSLSWVFVQVRGLSWLQWHPFSVSSSPLDGSNHLAILIKVLGDWTEKLRGHIITSVPEEEQGETDRPLESSFTLKASVEGPYGHESPYHLTYENLILVAGGIGISPFLAILSDILHRIRESKPCLPRNVLIVWAVKKSDELPLLQSLDLNSLCPYFKNTPNLEIQIYAPENRIPHWYEEGKIAKYESTCVFPAPSHGGGMSSLVGTGNIIWSGAYVVISTMGLVVCVALLHYFYINPYNIKDWWYKGLLLTVCMASSVVLFGGFVIGLWHLWDTKTSLHENSDGQNNLGGFRNNESNGYKNASQDGFVNIIKYGQRPDFKEIFGRMAERWGNIDVGVMVCGPTTLQTSIAKECRSKNFGRTSNGPIFHFNSHSFDL